MYKLPFNFKPKIYTPDSIPLTIQYFPFSLGESRKCGLAESLNFVPAAGLKFGSVWLDPDDLKFGSAAAWAKVWFGPVGWLILKSG